MRYSLVTHLTQGMNIYIFCTPETYLHVVARIPVIPLSAIFRSHEAIVFEEQNAMIECFIFISPIKPHIIFDPLGCVIYPDIILYVHIINYLNTLVSPITPPLCLASVQTNECW